MRRPGAREYGNTQNLAEGRGRPGVSARQRSRLARRWGESGNSRTSDDLSAAAPSCAVRRHVPRECQGPPGQRRSPRGCTELNASRRADFNPGVCSPWSHSIVSSSSRTRRSPCIPACPCSPVATTPGNHPSSMGWQSGSSAERRSRWSAGLGLGDDESSPINVPSLKHLWTNLKTQKTSEPDGYTLKIRCDWQMDQGSRHLEFGLSLANDRLFVKEPVRHRCRAEFQGFQSPSGLARCSRQRRFCVRERY